MKISKNNLIIIIVLFVLIFFCNIIILYKYYDVQEEIKNKNIEVEAYKETYKLYRNISNNYEYFIEYISREILLEIADNNLCYYSLDIDEEEFETKVGIVSKTINVKKELDRDVDLILQ